MINIKIIVGSTRPTRFGIKPATWLYELAQQRGDATFDLVDLKEINLPILDEAKSAKMDDYEHEHTKRWSEIIKSADGFVFVTPEYNHSIPASLKNAIDYLYNEWNYKPVAFLSYGALAGGSRAVEHLRQIAAELKMFDLRDQVQIINFWEQLDEHGNLKISEQLTKSAELMLEQLVFWTEHLKDPRLQLAQKS